MSRTEISSPEGWTTHSYQISTCDRRAWRLDGRPLTHIRWIIVKYCPSISWIHIWSYSYNLPLRKMCTHISLMTSTIHTGVSSHSSKLCVGGTQCNQQPMTSGQNWNMHATWTSCPCVINCSSILPKLLTEHVSVMDTLLYIVVHLSGCASNEYSKLYIDILQSKIDILEVIICQMMQNVCIWIVIGKKLNIFDWECIINNGWKVLNKPLEAELIYCNQRNLFWFTSFFKDKNRHLWCWTASAQLRIWSAEPLCKVTTWCMQLQRR